MLISITFNLATNAVVGFKVVEVLETRVTIVCELPCFSKDIECSLSYVLLLNKSGIIMNPTFHISNITGNQYSYSYPSQNITITSLVSNKSYHFCVHANNLTTMKISGRPLCGTFTTKHDESDGDHKSQGNIVYHITVYPSSAMSHSLTQVDCEHLKQSLYKGVLYLFCCNYPPCKKWDCKCHTIFK